MEVISSDTVNLYFHVAFSQSEVFSLQMHTQSMLTMVMLPLDLQCFSSGELINLSVMPLKEMGVAGGVSCSFLYFLF